MARYVHGVGVSAPYVRFQAACFPIDQPFFARSRLPASMGEAITNVLLSPDFQRLRAELIRVLARYPEARAEVAAVFRQAGSQAATQMGASPEKIIEALPVEAEHAA